MAQTKPEMKDSDITFLENANQEDIVKRWPRTGGNPSATDWMIRISKNNPSPTDSEIRKEMTPEDVFSCLEKAVFVVFQLEEGKENGYRHYQCFAQFKSATRLSSIRKAFTSRGFTAQYIAPRQFSIASCLAYCSKTKTRLEGPWNKGEATLPPTDSKQLLLDCEAKLAEGSTTVNQLLLNFETQPAVRGHLNYLRAIEEAALREKWSNTDRDVKVHYLWGAPRHGKTWHLTHELYSYQEIYRVTSWKHPWDSYESQPVLILDEFDAQPDFHDLCQLLEGYPQELEARYSNRWAAWSEVWIVSNSPLESILKSYAAKGISEEMLPSLPGRISESIHWLDPQHQEISVPDEFASMQDRLKDFCKGGSMTNPLDPAPAA